jgi:predicted transcriptional regulator
MVSRILDALFGCGHKHYTFPMTIKKGRRSAAASVTGTYVVCLDCGKEFPYDWKQMRIVNPHGERVGVPSLATKEAA